MSDSFGSRYVSHAGEDLSAGGGDSGSSETQGDLAPAGAYRPETVKWENLNGGWNYRVVHTKLPYPEDIAEYDGEYEDQFEIYEVYYDENNVARSWTISSSHPLGNTVAELQEDLRRMMNATFKSVITLEELEAKKVKAE